MLPGLHAPTLTYASRLRESLAPALVRLAAQGFLLGKSSWKYPGWCGLVYECGRYVFRGEFSDTRFQQRCLEECAETFPTVGVDATYCAWPKANLVAGLKRSVSAYVFNQWSGGPSLDAQLGRQERYTGVAEGAQVIEGVLGSAVRGGGHVARR